MKRILIIGGAVVASLVIAVVVLLASTFGGMLAVPETFEIEGMEIVGEGFGSIAVIPTAPARVALIDAGNDPSGEVLMAYLSNRGLEPDSVEAILLTHGHPDHIGAIPLFPDAEVIALSEEVPLIEGRTRAGSPVGRFFPPSDAGIRVSRTVSDGEVLTIGDARIRVFSVPGHTAGSAAYLVNRVLFLGDNAAAESDGGIRGAPWIFSDDTGENHASLARLYERLLAENVEVRALAFAHSGALVDGLEPLARFVQGN